MLPAIEIEAVVHYAVTEKLRVGLNGAYWIGLDDAQVEGDDLDDSKPKNIKLGLNCSYQVLENLNVGIRWMHDVESESYPEGDWAYLKLTYVF